MTLWRGARLLEDTAKPYNKVSISNYGVGGRKRKKPARFENGDDEYGSENQPPRSLPKLGSDSIILQAQKEALLPFQKLELGRQSLGGQLSGLSAKDQASTRTPLGESNLSRLNEGRGSLLGAPGSAPAKLTQEDSALAQSLKQAEEEEVGLDTNLFCYKIC